MTFGYWKRMFCLGKNGLVFGLWCSFFFEKRDPTGKKSGLVEFIQIKLSIFAKTILITIII
jgi:hypothetical protein